MRGTGGDAADLDRWHHLSLWGHQGPGVLEGFCVPGVGRVHRQGLRMREAPTNPQAAQFTSRLGRALIVLDNGAELRGP